MVNLSYFISNWMFYYLDKLCINYNLFKAGIKFILVKFSNGVKIHATSIRNGITIQCFIF